MIVNNCDSTFRIVDPCFLLIKFLFSNNKHWEGKKFKKSLGIKMHKNASKALCKCISLASGHRGTVLICSSNKSF